MSGAATTDRDARAKGEAQELLDEGDRILADATLVNQAWLRAASLLYRSAIEEALRRYWRANARGVDTTNWRCQLLCLAGYIDEREAAAVASAWGALSELTHHRTTLAPHRTDVVRLGEEARRCVKMLVEQSDGSKGGQCGSKR